MSRNLNVLQITVTSGDSFLTYLLLQMENISLYSIQKEAAQSFISIGCFIALFYWH